jgi:hypothetical protein
MKAETQPRSIVGRYEIADIVGVTRQGVASVLDHPDFPPPICSIGKNSAPLFWRKDVEGFDRERREAAGKPDADVEATAV